MNLERKELKRISIGIVLLLVVFLLGFFTSSFLTVIGQIIYAQSLSPLENTAYNASISIVAVKSSGGGVVASGLVEIKPGQGRVLIDTNPFVEPDTQYSFELAKKIAETITGKYLGDRDIIYSVPDSPAQLIGGRSAGAAFTVATIAALEGKKIKGDSAMTGTIEADGRIGPISGIVDKLVAFGREGGKLFLVPRNQSTAVYYAEEVKEERRGNYYLRRVQMIPKTIDLKEYAKENYEMEVREVNNIKEAVEYLVE